MKKISIQEVSVSDIIDIHKAIPEFKETPPEKLTSGNRYDGRKLLVLCAYVDDQKAGYMVSYDRYCDQSFYCWMAGVIPAYREQGVLTELMNYLFKWAKLNGFSRIKLKTRNERREMLNFLIKCGFFFTSIEPKENIKDNRLNLEIAVDDYDIEAQLR